jgi:predicted transcriptional regulator
VFSPADPDEVADAMQRLLNDWYAEMGQLIAEFREKYEDAADGERAAPPEPE